MSQATSLDSTQRRQFLWITVAAVALFAGLRLLPTGTSLSHMDFRVDPRAGNAIEFCDPLNPQFIPVVAVRSPVSLALATTEPPIAGRSVTASVTLLTSNGKPIAPEDLLVTHTRRLHLLVVDPTLTDYQHVHPQPGRTRGEWTFEFTPRSGGTYRVFADFTPAATARGLYASADLDVAGPAGKGSELPPTSRDGYSFELTTAPTPIRAGRPIDLRFAVRRDDGATVPLQTVMGAYAHLVAFDQDRNGFAHLHPVEPETQVPDATRPVLNFKLTIPTAGRYVVWAQVNLAGNEMFVPFTLNVAPPSA